MDSPFFNPYYDPGHPGNFEYSYGNDFANGDDTNANEDLMWSAFTTLGDQAHQELGSYSEETMGNGPETHINQGSMQSHGKNQYQNVHQQSGTSLDIGKGFENTNQMTTPLEGTHQHQQVYPESGAYIDTGSGLENAIQATIRIHEKIQQKKANQNPGKERISYGHLQLVLEATKLETSIMYADDESNMVAALHDDLDRAFADCEKRAYPAQEILDTAVHNSHHIVKAFAVTEMCMSRRVTNSRNIHSVATHNLQLPIDLAIARVDADLNAHNAVNTNPLQNSHTGKRGDVPLPSPFTPGGNSSKGDFSSNNAHSNARPTVVYEPGEFVMVDPSLSHAPSRALPKRKDTAPDCLGNAPSANILSPKFDGKPINVTAVELLAFLPRCFKSTDVIERFVSNGVTNRVICTIVDAHRDTARPVYDSYFLSSMKRRMRSKGDQTAAGGYDYSNWTPGMHTALPNHSPNSLDVSGFRTDYELSVIGGYQISTRETDAKFVSIPFKELAKDVKLFPSSFDALNLTRCVEYARDNPEEEWTYPEDFERLVAHISNGSPEGNLPTAEHYDAAAFRRWKAQPTPLGNQLRHSNRPKKALNVEEAIQGLQDTDEDETDEPPRKRTRGES